jgi:ribonuclease P protein component
MGARATIAAAGVAAVDCGVCAAAPPRRGAVTCAPTRAEEAMREAHVPTQQPPAQQEARVSPAHADPRGPGPVEEAAIEGPDPALRLIWRVRDPRAFRALASARRFRRGPLVLSCCRAAQAGPPRVAYAVGRHAGGAVERNRIRRRLRHVVRNHSERLRPGYQYLVGAGPEALSAPAAELNDVWVHLVDQAHGGLR